METRICLQKLIVNHLFDFIQSILPHKIYFKMLNKYQGYFKLNQQSEQQASKVYEKVAEFFMQNFRTDDLGFNIRKLAILHGMPSSSLWDDYKFHPEQAHTDIQKSIALLESAEYHVLPEDRKKRLLVVFQFLNAYMSKNLMQDPEFIKLVKQMCPVY